MKQVYRSNLFMLVIIIGQILGSMFLIKPLNKIFTYYQLLVVTQLLFLLVPVIIFFIITKLPIKVTLRLNKISIEDISTIIIIAIISQPIASFLSELSSIFFKNTLNEVFNELSSISLVTQLVIVALVPALCEEVTMRGVILSGYEKVSRWKAAIATGLLFGILHLSPQQFLYAFVMGILIAYIVRITNSIFSSMIYHFTFNAIQVVLAYTIAKVSPNLLNNTKTTISMAPEDYLISLIPSLLMSLLFVILIIWLLRSMEKRHNSKEILASEKSSGDYKDKGIGGLPRSVYKIKEEKIINLPYIAIVSIYILLMIYTGMK